MTIPFCLSACFFNCLQSYRIIVILAKNVLLNVAGLYGNRHFLCLSDIFGIFVGNAPCEGEGVKSVCKTLCGNVVW